MRNHWHDVGVVFAVGIGAVALSTRTEISSYQFVMLLNLVALLLHQFEEYRLPGTFPGMVNRVMYRSTAPDRYPLNTNTALIVNVFVGWTLYVLPIAVGERAVWLGITAMTVSVGNIIAHTILFPVKGRMLYNAGLATCWLCFVPCVFLLVDGMNRDYVTTLTDVIIGVVVGTVVNVVGVVKPITWLASTDTTFVFTQQQVE